MRKHQINVSNNQIDFQVQRELKKHSNYCNKIIKKEVREKNGTNITNVKNVKEIWNCISDILKPEKINKTSIKIETEGH